MRRTFNSLVIFCAMTMGILGTAGAARATTLATTRGALGARDAADWGSLGLPSNSSVSNPCTMNTLGGLSIIVSKPTVGSGGFTFFVQGKLGDGFPPYGGGNFTALDNLLNTSVNDPSPISIVFKQPVSGAGAQI